MPKKNVKGYQYFILRLGVFLLLMWLLFFVFIGITHMPSTDMYPRVDAGDFVLFYRLDKDVRAQDIIVIEKEVPDMKGKQVFISRVVAVAGDTVEIDEERLIINGNTVVETNIFYPT
ncbi:MAG: signal peptidase I, partial [Lachnospiraceae bacterium]|nr:signal peptidase I [Lachnospiraceae bacterium]